MVIQRESKTVTEQKDGRGYLLMSLFFLIILPVLSLLGEFYFEKEPLSWALAGKWFVFSAIGMRLFTAGVSQASNPGFTAGILGMKNEEGFVAIRELGFANIALGVMGILSVINNEWRLLISISGGLFFGMAGIQHLFRNPSGKKELTALVYDLTVFFFIIFLLVYKLFEN